MAAGELAGRRVQLVEEVRDLLGGGERRWWARLVGWPGSVGPVGELVAIGEAQLHMGVTAPAALGAEHVGRWVTLHYLGEISGHYKWLQVSPTSAACRSRATSRHDAGRTCRRTGNRATATVGAASGFRGRTAPLHPPARDALLVEDHALVPRLCAARG